MIRFISNGVPMNRTGSGKNSEIEGPWNAGPPVSSASSALRNGRAPRVRLLMDRTVS